MEIGYECEVVIEKMTNLGLGLAKIDGMVVFVENSCPMDKLKIKITKSCKNYSQGTIVEILEPSPYRVKPICPMQKVCGSCQLQFIDYNYQLEIKRQIVQDALHSIAGINIEVPTPVKSPEIYNFRHKVQYPVSQTKNSKRILAGYYKPKSHEIVNIKYCPIQPEICDRIIDFIRNKAPEYRITGFEESKHYGDLRHVVIRTSTLNDKNLVVLVVNSNKLSENLKNFARAIYNEFEEVSGVCINLNDKKTNVILGDKTECVIGNEYIEEKIIDKVFVIGAGTFFQVNPKSAENIFAYVKDYVENNFDKPDVLDAYAGISAFGICLSDVSNSVVSIEENLSSVELAKKTAKIFNLQNIEINGGDAGKFFSKEKRKFDVVILDPPRKGCTVQSLDDAIKLCTDTIIYVSCNPATLSRDLKYLMNKGAKLLSIQPFDMFCHTYHIENVAIIKVS